MKKSTSTPIRFIFKGDETRAQQLTGIARKLLGGVEAQKKRRDGGFGHRVVSLADGERVSITSLRGIANITIEVPITAGGPGWLAVVPYDFDEAPDGWGEPFNEANPRGTPGGDHPEVLIHLTSGQLKRRPDWEADYPDGLFYGTWGSYTDGADLYSWGDPGASKAGSGRWSFKNGSKHVLFDSEIADGFTGYREIVFVSDTVVVVGGEKDDLVQFYTYTYSGDGSVVQTDDHQLSTTLYDDAVLIQRRNTSEFYLLDLNDDPVGAQFPRLLDLAPEELTEEFINTPTALYPTQVSDEVYTASYSMQSVPTTWDTAGDGFWHYADMMVSLNQQYNWYISHYAEGEVFVWVDRSGNPIIKNMVADRSEHTSWYLTFTVNPNYNLDLQYNSEYTKGSDHTGHQKLTLGGEVLEDYVYNNPDNFTHSASHAGSWAEPDMYVIFADALPAVGGSKYGVGDYLQPPNVYPHIDPPYRVEIGGVGFSYTLDGSPGQYSMPIVPSSVPDPYANYSSDGITISPSREWILMVYDRSEKLLFEGTYESDLYEDWLEPVIPDNILMLVDAPRLRDPGAI